mgnify:CR=1 FL=1
MTKLGQVASIRMGYPFRSRLEHDAMGTIAVVQMKDIDDASALHVEDAVRVELADFKEHHLIRPGDLVFRSRGRTNSVALVLADIGPAVLAAPMLLVRPMAVLPSYLLWYINLPKIQASLAAQAEGTSVRMISKAALEASQWEIINSRNTLRTFFDNIPSCVYIVDRSYTIMIINNRRGERVDKTPQELVGSKCYEKLYGYTAPCPLCRVADAFMGVPACLLYTSDAAD